MSRELEDKRKGKKEKMTIFKMDKTATIRHSVMYVRGGINEQNRKGSVNHAVTLCYTTLHYTTPHHTTLHYTTYTAPHHTTHHYTTLHHTTPYKYYRDDRTGQDRTGHRLQNPLPSPTLVSEHCAPGGWNRPIAVSLKFLTSIITEFSSSILSWNSWGVKCVPPSSKGASKGLNPYVTI